MRPHGVVAPFRPFKGLRPFEASEQDALLFFGREAERELISANLMASRFTVLYGESGVGKTSLLAAGVVHHLRGIGTRNLEGRGHPEFVVVMFSSWGDDPVPGLLEGARDALAGAFGSSGVPAAGRAASLADTLQGWTDELGCDLLLILDQAEEYFLYHETETGANTFAEQLPELVTRSGLRVSTLLSIREDAVAKLDRFKGRIPNLFGNYLRLEHLDREAARAAIVGPVEQHNRLASDADRIEVEPELVPAVLDQTAAGRVALGQAGRGVVRGSDFETRIETPFLQLVLDRLWDEEVAAGSRILRAETLRRLGGAGEIVRGHLEHALEELSPAQKDIAASLFNYLVTPSGAKIAHAPRDLAEYATVAEAELSPVLSTLVRERILRPAASRNGASTSDASPVEIFHDVLADAVLAWRTRHEADRALDRQRRNAERRHRRTVALAGASVLALAIVAAVAVFALVQRGEAREQAREARAQQADARIAARRARARELAARAASILAADPHRSLRLAVDAARLERTLQIEDVLRSALVFDRVRAILPVAGGPVMAATFSPDGSLVAAAGQHGPVSLFRRDGQFVRALRHPGRVSALAFAPDASVLVTGGVRGAWLWRVGSRRRYRVLPHRGRVLDASFSRDGRFLATASSAGEVLVWGIPAGRLVVTLSVPAPARRVELSPDGGSLAVVAGDRVARLFAVPSGSLRLILEHRGVTSVAFSPGGRLLATGSADRTARLWDTRRAEPWGKPLAGHVGRVVDAEFSPRGTLLVTASTDGTARVWDLNTGQLVTPLSGHGNVILDTAFSPNGSFVAAASADRTARVWKADTGTFLAGLAGHRDSVSGVSFSSDGNAILTRSDDGSARIWDSGTKPELRLFTQGRGPFADAAFSPDGTLVVSAEAAGRVEIRSARDGRLVRSFRGRSRVSRVAFTPDGTRLALASGRFAEIRRSDDGRVIRRIRHPAQVVDVAFSPDGRKAVTAGRDGIARIWSADGGRLVRSLARHRGPLTAVALSPDGALVATAGEDGLARIWDAASGRVRTTLRGHRDAVTSVAFSPNGRRVVTSSRDHDARIWDPATGRGLRLLRAHFAVISDVAFSADGRWVVTAGPLAGGLLDAQSGRLLLHLRGHSGRLTAASFDRSNRRVLTASVDGTVRVYRCSVCGGVDELVTLAEARLVQAGPRR